VNGGEKSGNRWQRMKAEQQEAAAAEAAAAAEKGAVKGGAMGINGAIKKKKGPGGGLSTGSIQLTHSA
jgi:hypothetical protein